MDIHSCGTACFNQPALYFALWSTLIVVSFSILVRALNRMFVPNRRQAALPEGQQAAVPLTQRHV